MPKIEKTYEQVTDFNVDATAYLKKTKVVDDNAKEIKGASKSRTDIALLDILMKQIVKKIIPGKAKAVHAIKRKNALTDTATGKLLVAERANANFGIPFDVYDHTIAQAEQIDKDVDALEQQKVDIHQRAVLQSDWDLLTPEEKESFTDFLIVEPVKEA